MLPKAPALDLISATEDSLKFMQAAKTLAMYRDRLTHWMNQNGSWVAYRKQIQNRHLQYKATKYTSKTTGELRHKHYCHLTPKTGDYLWNCNTGRSMSNVIPFPTHRVQNPLHVIRVEIWKGHAVGNQTPMWYTAVIDSTGADMIMHEKPSYAEALLDAKETAEDFGLSLSSPSF